MKLGVKCCGNCQWHSAENNDCQYSLLLKIFAAREGICSMWKPKNGKDERGDNGMNLETIKVMDCLDMYYMKG